MDVQRRENPGIDDAVAAWPRPIPPTGALHAGLLDGATLTGEATRRNLTIKVGLWLDEAGWVRRARWRATENEPLRDYAEAACALLEAGADPLRLDGTALRAAVADAPPGVDDGAEVVAAAIAVALLARGAGDGSV